MRLQKDPTRRQNRKKGQKLTIETPQILNLEEVLNTLTVTMVTSVFELVNNINIIIIIIIISKN